MSLLIESIKLENGVFYNAFYHERRMNRALQTLCGSTEDFELESFLSRLEVPAQGLYKCRIVYDEKTREVEFLPYQPRYVRNVRVVEHDRIVYDHKYADRKTINRLFDLRDGCDDVLIVKRGLVTDASYCNIVFRRGKEWFTPWSALLKGTQRQKLLDHDQIREEEISAADIRSFDTFKLINAMVEFEGPEIEVSSIVF